LAVHQISDIEGRILRNEALVPGYYLASLRLSTPLPLTKPGQFVMLKVSAPGLLLRRPFSVYDHRGRAVSILYKVVGKGTAALASAGPKEEVMVLGPLGNGFTAIPRHKPVIVAGGIGLAGVRLLWSRLRGKASLFWGCGSDAEIGLVSGLFQCDPHVSTDDGSFGCRGNVIDLFAQHLPQMERPLQIFACGPRAMFQALRELLASERIPCQVLLEEKMACGLGICFGCVTKTIDEDEPYKRVCKEGPVFDLWQISL
jgi:dihydroorotate dehydrogenase electron transfer subunit